MDTIKLKRQFRNSEIISGNINIDDRTVDVSFSSELPVKRWFGTEILDHSPESVDLARLNNGGAVMIDHYSDQVGVIQLAEIKDRKGFARLKFSQSQKGKEVFQDIIDGIRKNISVGYEIQKLQETKSKEETILRALKWMPYEISIVSIPADSTIGVGRGSQDTEIDVEILKVEEEIRSNSRETENKQNLNKKESIMSDTASSQIDVKTIENEANKQERARVKEIMSVVKDKPEAMDLAQKAIADGMSFADFGRSFIKDFMGGKAIDLPQTQNIGMSRKDIKEFSFLRAINALFEKDRSLAPFEFECSDAACKTRKKETTGICIPHDVLSGKRDYSAGSPADGGNLIGTNLMSGSFIDLLRNSMVMHQAGMQTLSGLVGNLAIPKQTGGCSAFWINENGSPTKSSASFQQIGMTPKTVGARTQLSRKFILQSSMDAESFARKELMIALALELDRVALHGSGVSPEPLGIFNNTEVNTISLGTNGAVPTFKKIVEMETAVNDNNAAIGSMAYITNARGVGLLKTTEKVSATNAFLLENWLMNGYALHRTNQIRKDFTKGTGTDLSGLVFGVFSNIIMGMWSGIDLLVDPYTEGDSGALKIRVLQDVDLVCRYPQAFSIVTDMKTA